MASDWNRRVIEEFRSNGGAVGSFPGNLLLLTTTGRKSGQQHTTPLMYLQEGDNIFVFASKGGAPTDPHWFLNILANPTVQVELGNDSFTADAVVVNSEERDRIYAVQAERNPQFREYQEKTTRKIPVVALKRRA
jgi:deazaflavin-dependent oxidoreductase (nitroreductase family)